MGAVIIPLMAIYLALLAWATWRGWRWAVNHGWRGRKRWLGAACGFLLVYLPVMWDWLPTMAAHKYYCEKEAGFWVYKTVDQWKAENPGVMEKLAYRKDMPKITTRWGKATVLNQRFLYLYRFEGPLLINRWRIEMEIRDSANGEMIARQINFYASQERQQSGWSGWKFWLNGGNCKVESHRDPGSFDQLITQIEGAKK
jgi:hypothetical protein